MVNDMDPSPVCPEAFKEVNWGGDVCALLRNLLMTNEKLGSFFEWMFKPPGDPPAASTTPCVLSTQFAAQLVSLGNPIGSGFWSPVPLNLDKREWVECNGQSLDRVGDYANLFAVLGISFKPEGFSDDTKFHLPNLQGRFLLNRGQRDPFTDNTGITHIYPTYDINDPKGGDDQVGLLPINIPSIDHKHGVYGFNGKQSTPVGIGNDAGVRYMAGGITVDTYTGLSGDIGPDWGGQTHSYDKVHLTTTEVIERTNTVDEEEATQPHSNMPPYFVGIYYMRANFIHNGEIIKMKSVSPPV